MTKISCGVWTKLRFASRRKPKPLPEISIMPSPYSGSRGGWSPFGRPPGARSGSSEDLIFARLAGSQARFARRLRAGAGFLARASSSRTSGAPRCPGSSLSDSLKVPGPRSASLRRPERRRDGRRLRNGALGAWVGCVFHFFAHNCNRLWSRRHDRVCRLAVLKLAISPAIRQGYLNWNRRFERRRRLRGSRKGATPEAQPPRRRHEQSCRE